MSEQSRPTRKLSLNVKEQIPIIFDKYLSFCQAHVTVLISFDKMVGFMCVYQMKFFKGPVFRFLFVYLFF